ncbi:MAG: ABC transporter permease [Candidatus Paceibacterota bacterium]|jgi:putative ABC transport system permease protein
MKTRFLIKESLQALRHNVLRSLLTIIGIIVGIISVTAMLGLGSGLSNNITEQFNSFASGDLSVSGDLTHADFLWIKEQPYVKAAFAEKPVIGVTTLAYNTEFYPSITSVVGDYAKLRNYEVVAGDVFDTADPDFSERVAVVSESFQEAVAEEIGQTPTIGQRIVIGSQQYEIVGVIAIESAGFGGGDGTILIPYRTTVGTFSNSASFSSVNISLKDSSLFEVAGEDILAGLNASRYLALDSDEIFQAQTAQSLIEAIQQTTGMITIFLGIIGGIALFVGGIGTMNMMLTSVTERTKEIGLRKAVGARNRDILLQILIESVALTTLGGAVGIGITVIISYFTNQLLANSSFPISLLISWKVVLLAFLVSFAIGVIFGLYPARNASRLQPVDALRSE